MIVVDMNLLMRKQGRGQYSSSGYLGVQTAERAQQQASRNGSRLKQLTENLAALNSPFTVLYNFCRYNLIGLGNPNDKCTVASRTFQFLVACGIIYTI